MKKNPSALLLSVLFFILMSCGTGNKSGTPIYLDTSYSFEERAADLVSRLTLEEKQSLLGNSMAAVPRLSINEYNVWGEALHGLVGMFNPNYESATSFPNSVAVGASWDPALVERETRIISEEARGANYPVINGLTYWSPVVEPMRDPRWGRTAESFGEDPFLISQIAGGFIRGMMGDDATYLKAVPLGKHYLANNSEFNRHSGSSNMDDRDMREFYLAPYKKLIEKDDLPGIMTCYNRVNEVPVTASKYFVDSIARKTYGLYGYVTGDCGAVSDIYTGHLYAKTPEEAAAMALKAGVDTDCGSVFQTSVINALKAGLIDESDIDRALVNMFTIRMRIGEFDPTDKVPYADIEPEVINAPAHTELAVEVATKTAVLLKNTAVSQSEPKALPLNASELKKIAVIGPLADRVELGPYSGTPLESNIITPLAGIKALLAEKESTAEIVYSQGANTASRSNMFNVYSFELVRNDGSVAQYDATKFNTSSEGIIIAGGMSPEKSLKNINDGDWTSYRNINLSNVKSVGLRLTVNGDGGSVEVKTGSVSGNIVATLNVEAQQGMGAFRPATISADVNQLGLTGNQTLFLVYRAPEKIPIDQETISMASSSDVAVVFVGTDDKTASEESDRSRLVLPGNQYELIKAVAEANPHTIVVMQTLGMVEVDPFKDLPNVAGIIWTGYNGQAQGAAIAKILFGEVNPGGKLNATWYKSVNDLPDITDYNLRGANNKNGRTYWYFKKDVSYEFGYGLSYATFEYSNFRISSPAVTPNDNITISADVTNTSDVDGDEVVQVYMRTPESPAALERPVKRLKGFQRVSIPAGETKTVSIEIDCADLWFWDADADKIAFDQGKYIFEIGASSKDIKGEVETTMSGIYNAVLKTVVAECSKVVLELDDRIQTNVSAVLSDDSFYDITQTQVSYSSSNSGVVSVDENGMATATGPGVALVTASVTIDDITVSDSYPLKVMPDLTLSSITVDGNEIPSFNPDIRSYSVLITEDTRKVSEVNATPSNNDVDVETIQAEGIPGTAIITITDPVTGEKDVYKVNFGTESVSDEFEENTLGDYWSWILENQENWSLSEHPGYMDITAQDGDIQGSGNNAENILLQSANTDWVIESKLEFSRRPVKFGEQGGILAYQDDDQYVKLVYIFTSAGMMSGYDEYIELAVENYGSLYSAARIPVSDLFEDETDISFVLKLEKKGSKYTAYYSTGGNDFKLLGSTQAVLSNINAGMIANNGTGPGGGRFAFMMPAQDEDTEPLKVQYDYFRIENTGSQ